MTEKMPNLGGGSKKNPKKETVRINLPPKPTEAPIIKIPNPAVIAGMETKSTEEGNLPQNIKGLPEDIRTYIEEVWEEKKRILKTYKEQKDDEMVGIAEITKKRLESDPIEYFTQEMINNQEDLDNFLKYAGKDYTEEEKQRINKNLNEKIEQLKKVIAALQAGNNSTPESGPKFYYEAVDTRGKGKVTGTLDVASQKEAVSALKKMGYLPTKVEQVGGPTETKTGKKEGAKAENGEEATTKIEREKVIKEIKGRIKANEAIVKKNDIRIEEIMKRLAEIKLESDKTTQNTEKKPNETKAESTKAETPPAAEIEIKKTTEPAVASLLDSKREELKKATGFRKIFERRRLKKEIYNLEQAKDREQNPFKYYLIDKISNENFYNMLLIDKDKKEVPVEKINSIMGEDGEKVLFWEPTLIEEERDYTVAFSSNGFYLKLTNRKEVPDSDGVELNNPKAKYELYSPDGKRIADNLAFNEGNKLLKEQAEEYQKRMREDFQKIRESNI